MKRRVLLIGWDAADWDHLKPLLQDGLMPTLASLMQRGVHGNLATLQPILSPMLWNSVSTGKLPAKHGIHGFVEPDPLYGGIRPYSSLSRQCRAIWNILHHEGHTSHVVNWWASYPAEPIRGCISSNLVSDISLDVNGELQIPPGTFHPEALAEHLANCKVFPHEITAPHILPLVPYAAEIDQNSDRRLKDLRVLLADCATTQSITTAMMEAEPWDFVATYNTAIDHFAHGFMDYDPPQRSHISDADFRMYQGVMQGAYRFHDMMLERLLHLAGPETTIILCSDHGFQSKEHRPRGIPRDPTGPAAWHRPYGILVMAGPGIRAGECLYGASLLDITPTILHLFGLPIGEDMDGRPLLEALTFTDIPSTIPSWDSVPGDFAELDPNTRPARRAGAALMDQFAALGYVEDRAASDDEIAKLARIEAQFNLARSYKWTGKNTPARQILESLLNETPWENRFILHLVDSYMREGFLGRAEELLRAAFAETTRNIGALLLWSRIKSHQHDDAGTTAFLNRALTLEPNGPAIHTHLGDALLRQRRTEEAIAEYQRAIARDADFVEAHVGLSTAYLRLHRLQETISTALHCIELVYRIPRAHYNLGVALARNGEQEKSIQVFETLLKFAPHSKAAHRWLAVLYWQHSTNVAKSEFHTHQVHTLLQREAQRPMLLRAAENTLSPLPMIPSEAERIEHLVNARPDAKAPKSKSGKTFYLVSGIPRSGTSLMMQMLAMGGMQIKTDGQRAADRDNPRGYYEWEAIKSLIHHPQLLEEPGLESHVIKIVSPLLRHLPPEHHYKILFMMRPLEQVAKSQEKMLARIRPESLVMDQDSTQRALQRHLDELQQWYRQAEYLEVCEIDYAQLVAEPSATIGRIVEFFGEERLPQAARMSQAVEQSLHRNHSSPK